MDILLFFCLTYMIVDYFSDHKGNEIKTMRIWGRNDGGMRLKYTSLLNIYTIYSVDDNGRPGINMNIQYIDENGDRQQYEGFAYEIELDEEVNYD